MTTPTPNRPYNWQVPPPPVEHHYHYAQPTKTNGLAVAGMVLGILWLYWIGSVLAVIFGHVAIYQINRNPQASGKGMAVAAVVLGWIGVGILTFILLAAAGASSSG